MDKTVAELITELVNKLGSTVTIIDPETKLAARVSHNGSLQVNEIKKKEDCWLLTFSNIIPTNLGSFFCYIRNDEAIPITISDINVSSTIANGADCVISAHRISGELEFINYDSLTPVRLTSLDRNLNIISLACKDIQNVIDEGVVGRINIPTAFDNEELELDVVLYPGEAIGIKWGASIGALSGTIEIEMEI